LTKIENLVYTFIQKSEFLSSIIVSSKNSTSPMVRGWNVQA